MSFLSPSFIPQSMADLPREFEVQIGSSAAGKISPFPRCSSSSAAALLPDSLYLPFVFFFCLDHSTLSLLYSQLTLSASSCSRPNWPRLPSLSPFVQAVAQVGGHVRWLQLVAVMVV
jgi:hypothetical protein